jgi:hypothetical protein
LLFSEAHSTQHSQAIRVECHYRIGTGKEENLFRTGIPDAWESLQSFFCFREWLLESRPQIAVELFIGDFRDGEKFFCAYVREYPGLADSGQTGVLSGKNLFRACSNRLF